MLERLQRQLEADGKKGAYIPKKATGMLFIQMYATIFNLSSLTTAFPSDSKTGICLSEGYFGAVYNEETDPLIDIMRDNMRFLCQVRFRV